MFLHVRQRRRGELKAGASGFAATEGALAGLLVVAALASE